MSGTPKHLLIILGLGSVIFFTSLGSVRLWDRDEPRNAGCAAEMLERGNWVVPMFNDELRPQKPVLLYWLMMSAYGVFGINEFSARFWSALLGLGSLAATYFIGTRIFSRQIGILAALILASTMMFDVAARAATPDSLLIFCSTMAMLVYVYSVPWKKAKTDATVVCFPQKTIPTILFYSFLGLATLAKGPVGFVLPMAIIGMFMLIRRSRTIRHDIDSQSRFSIVWQNVLQTWRPDHFLKTVWAMKPIVGVLTILAIAAPWYVAVGIQTEGDFLKQFFLYENFGRATTVLENHSGGFWYYPAAILFGFFPWSVFLVPVGIHLKKRISEPKESKAKPAITFLLCWVLVQVGIFSLASTKLPSYVTPCYPALAILFAFAMVEFVIQGANASSKFWYQAAFATMCLCGVLIAGGLVFISRQYLGHMDWVAVLALIPIIGGIVGFWCLKKNNVAVAMATAPVTAILFAISIFGIGTRIVDSTRTTAQVLEPLSQAKDEVATFGVLESSWVVYSDRRIFELDKGHSKKNQTLDRNRFWHKKPRVTPESFIAANPNGAILTTTEHVVSLMERLPNLKQVAETDYFLNDQKLIVLSQSNRSEETRTAATSQTGWIR